MPVVEGSDFGDHPDTLPKSDKRRCGLGWLLFFGVLGVVAVAVPTIIAVTNRSSGASNSADEAERLRSEALLVLCQAHPDRPECQCVAARHSDGEASGSGADQPGGRDSSVRNS